MNTSKEPKRKSLLLMDFACSGALLALSLAFCSIAMMTVNAVLHDGPLRFSVVYRGLLGTFVFGGLFLGVIPALFAHGAKEPALPILDGMICFLLIGPPLGWLALDLLVSIRQGAAAGLNGNVLAFGSLFSYLLGGVPAAACGVVSGAVRSRIRPASHAVVVGLCGALCAWAFLEWCTRSKTGAGAQDTLLAAYTGFASGSMCSWLQRHGAIGRRLSDRVRSYLGPKGTSLIGPR